MARWHPTFNPAHLYFVTTGCFRQYHLFNRDITKRLIVDILDCVRLRKRFKLYAFVVMPNHVHLIVQCRDADPLGDAIRDFHVADRLLRDYRRRGNRAALKRLCLKGRQGCKVWEESYDAKDVFTPEFLRQKMTYIHNNPLQPRWYLVASAEGYLWSSACYYLLGRSAIIPIDNASLLLY
jgi:REP element-mobilizing transposase RayT